MSNEAIARDLDRLAELAAEIQSRRDFYQTKRDKLLKVLKPKLATIDQSELDDLAGPLKDFQKLETQIKAATIACKESVKGSALQCVYVKPRINWNDDMLRGMAAATPAIMAARTEGAASAQIRKVANSQENTD